MSGYTLPDLDLCGRACRGLNQRQPFLTSNTVVSLLFGFFFQAEDGIRDDLVTGVQTCALPISYCRHARNRGALAQGRIPFVLEADLQGQEAPRKTTDVEGGSGIDLPDGR